MAIAKLNKKGYKTIMITGDNERTARAIAKLAGIDKVITMLMIGLIVDEKSGFMKVRGDFQQEKLLLTEPVKLLKIREEHFRYKYSPHRITVVTLIFFSEPFDYGFDLGRKIIFFSEGLADEIQKQSVFS